LRVEDALHALQIAAHDARDKVGVGDFRMARDQARRRVEVHAATARAADVAVGAGSFEKRGHARVVRHPGPAGRGRVIRFVIERGP
jgi:hypothetical protein